MREPNHDAMCESRLYEGAGCTCANCCAKCGEVLNSENLVCDKCSVEQLTVERDAFRARVARLEAAGRAMFESVVAYAEQYGLNHELDCPKDDTCECVFVQNVELGLQAVDAALAADAKEPRT